MYFEFAGGLEGAAVVFSMLNKEEDLVEKLPVHIMYWYFTSQELPISCY